MKALTGLGAALRELRERRDLSQISLAKRSGVHQTQVSRYERDAERPSIQSLGAILDALGFELYDLANALDQVNGRTPMLLPGTARPQWVALMKRLGIHGDVLAGIAAGIADPHDPTAGADLEASAREAAAQLAHEALDLAADASAKAQELMVAEPASDYGPRQRRKKR